MQRTIDETMRRRKLQKKYNEEHGMVPTALVKSTQKILGSTAVADGDGRDSYVFPEVNHLAADPVIRYMSEEQLEKALKYTRKQMEKAAKDLDFMEAARLRDELFALEQQKKKA
ncbi:MAG: hypothetical protein A3D92_05145 [Bacteroidetes bacterium RIFCSPHIGHO2_02_FULL_44_7]|nr:MAG: hypothetical protein A3D92_05145 [Bacteroidetes bacterium RIFCSPHIGHO2_02_FULL_44_7]